MYIGLKQIQNQLTDYQTLLTSSDGIHALTFQFLKWSCDEIVI